MAPLFCNVAAAAAPPGRMLSAAAMLLMWASTAASSDGAVSRLQNPFPLEAARPAWTLLEPGQEHTFDVGLRTGEAASVVVYQRGIDVVLTVIDPLGRLQHRVDRPNVEWGREGITILAHAAGIYRLHVAPLQPAGPAGRYRMELGRVHPADADDRRRVDAEHEVTEAEVARATNTLEGCRSAALRFDRAASLWRELREPYEESVALYGRALALRFLGEHEESLQLLRRMTALTDRVADSDAALLAESGLAWTFLYLDDYDDAALHFRRLLRRVSHDRRGRAVNLFGLGWTALMLGRPSAAEQSFRKSLRLRRAVRDRRGEALTLVGLAAALDRLDRWHEATTAAAEALQILDAYPDRYGRAEALTVKGWALLHEGEPAGAAESFAAARSGRRALEDTAGEAAALHGQAAALRRMGASSDALALAERSLELVETVRARRTDRDLRTEYFASVQQLYELCVDLLMERYAANGDIAAAERAFHVSERARARALLDRMRLRRNARESPPRRSDDPRPIRTDGNGEPLSVREVQRALDPDTTMLVYATGAARSTLWLISQEEFTNYDLPPVAAIDRRVQRLLEAISRPPSHRVDRERGAQTAGEVAAAGAALARMILPSDATRRAKKRIVFVPSGPLQSVPFGVLPPTGPSAAAAMLLDDHEVTTLPSASVIGSLRRAEWWARPDKTLAIFADPVLHASDARVRSAIRAAPPPAPDGDLPRLLGTRWEARAISRFIPADRETLALDFQAARSTLQRLDLSQYRILHFGTHAIVDLQRPERSGLVLSKVDANGRAVNGFIRADEILEWPLDADLVVLSGCRTGVGRDIRGEGLMALSRGFLEAGASRLIMSLWSVDDAATARLMVRLYEGMLGPEHLSPAAALRAAQLDMRASPRWHSSYFWSGFVLQGEWR